MKELGTIQNLIFRTGAILFVVGAGLHLFNPTLGMLAYAVGVLGFTSMQMITGYEGRDITLKRLRTQQVMSDICFLLSALAMMSQDLQFGPDWAHHNLWILFLIIGCVLQLYTSFRIPSELEKQRNSSKMRSLSILFVLPFLTSSCGTQYMVNGTTSVPMLEGRTLYLKAFDVDKMQDLDSCKVQHGKISFNGILDSIQMVNIFIGDESMMPLVLEQGIINIRIEENKQDVFGSPMNDSLYTFIHHKVKLDREMMELARLETRMIMDGIDEFERNQRLMQESQRIDAENDRLVTSFIIRNSDNVLGPGVFMIMTSAYPYPQMTPQIEEILFRAKPAFKEHPYVKRYIHAAKENMEKLLQNGN